MARLLLLLSVLVFAVAACYAAEPAGQVYWNKVLPNTPMPSAIKDILTTGPLATDFSKRNYAATDLSNRNYAADLSNRNYAADLSNRNYAAAETQVHGDPNADLSNRNYAAAETQVHGDPNADLSNRNYAVDLSNRNYAADLSNRNYAAAETQVHGDPNVALYFLEKDLLPGTKMTLHFTPTTSGTAFVTRREADRVPFSSAKLPQILNHFSVDPNSAEAEAMKTTLTECEDPANAGETKYCATSLESMVEFSTLSLGTRKVVAVSTTADKQNSRKQQYTILSSGVKKLSGSNNLVVCHAQNYAYAVFYCHNTHSTRAYEVSMAGEDGTKVEAVAVCHADTAGWNPKHVAFQVLGVKPGTVPVCHILPQDNVVWTPKKN